jgi:hypothetical protein
MNPNPAPPLAHLGVDEIRRRELHRQVVYRAQAGVGRYGHDGARAAVEGANGVAGAERRQRLERIAALHIHRVVGGAANRLQRAVGRADGEGVYVVGGARAGGQHALQAQAGRLKAMDRAAG